MSKNVTFPLGNIALIDKIDSKTGFFRIRAWRNWWSEQTIHPSRKTTHQQQAKSICIDQQTTGFYIG